MGTHPIFESDFDCLTDCQALRLAFEMAKKGKDIVALEETSVSLSISRRTRNKKLQECFVEVERVKLDMEEKELESGDAPVTTNVQTDPGQTKIDNIETPDEENIPVEGSDSEISENEQEKSDHGSEPDAEETEDVTKLSNKELKEKLTSLGITTGPIVDSTRKIYERKLEKLLTKGKDLVYSTDEDAVPEQEVESEEVEPVKKVTRTKKAPKPDPVVEEKFSDEEDEEPIVKNSSSRRRSARILKSKSKKETDIEQIDEQEEEAKEEAGVQQDEEILEENKEVEVATDESKSTESVQVLSTKTAITSHIHTILFLALVAIAGYLLYSEADAIQSALEDMWDYAVASYSRLYYSMMPEIETIQPDTPPPPAAEPQVGEPVPTDEL